MFKAEQLKDSVRYTGFVTIVDGVRWCQVSCEHGKLYWQQGAFNRNIKGAPSL